MKLSIIIPVYNEENTIHELLIKVNQFNLIEKEVIVVDDSSTDTTVSILNTKSKNLYDKIIFLNENRGKGHACRIGLKEVSGDIILFQDADLEYDPNDYSKLIQPILEKKCFAVYGSRVLGIAKRRRPKNILIFFSYLANFFLTTLSNMLNKQKLTDAHTCYKVFLYEKIKDIILVEDGFNFCPEITAKISKKILK